MTLMITDTGSGNRQGRPCAVARGLRLPALAIFVGGLEVAIWH